jgi:hypothetical protein
MGAHLSERGPQDGREHELKALVAYTPGKMLVLLLLCTVDINVRP